MDFVGQIVLGDMPISSAMSLPAKGKLALFYDVGAGPSGRADADFYARHFC